MGFGFRQFIIFQQTVKLKFRCGRRGTVNHFSGGIPDRPGGNDHGFFHGIGREVVLPVQFFVALLFGLLRPVSEPVAAVRDLMETSAVDKRDLIHLVNGELVRILCQFLLRMLEECACESGGVRLLHFCRPDSIFLFFDIHGHQDRHFITGAELAAIDRSAIDRTIFNIGRKKIPGVLGVKQFAVSDGERFSADLRNCTEIDLGLDEQKICRLCHFFCFRIPGGISQDLRHTAGNCPEEAEADQKQQ